MPDREKDPGIIHLLDQEAAEFNTHADEFAETYGFEHKCNCDEDYTAGRVGEATLCFTMLAHDALEACRRMKAELDTLHGPRQ